MGNSGIDLPTMVAVGSAAVVVLLVVLSFLVPRPKAGTPTLTRSGPAPLAPRAEPSRAVNAFGATGGIGTTLIDHLEAGQRAAAAQEIERRLAAQQPGDYVDGLLSKLVIGTPPPPPPPPPPES